MSINNNWINACNVDLVWRHLRSQLHEVKKSCADVESTPGWNEACQVCFTENLNSSIGLFKSLGGLELPGIFPAPQIHLNFPVAF